ncbi:MAG: hypothetical protein OXI76_09850 [Gemmatimonadota bacterium]|nr:hypothetical protein [Gemmatimonadota bacterium]MYD13293.1 hypothetical protein [Gemmatimonadota bacterium]
MSAPDLGDVSGKSSHRERQDSFRPITLRPLPDPNPIRHPRPRRTYRLEIRITPELRDRLREAAEGVKDADDNWWDRPNVGAVVREVLRSALGMPTRDRGRTLERLAAWRGRETGAVSRHSAARPDSPRK